jgi:NMD protein affecting ribosome stability and mRNA decay
MTACPRCGAETAGKSKTGLCQLCAVHFANLKRPERFKTFRTEAGNRGVSRKKLLGEARHRRVAITLAGGSK